MYLDASRVPADIMNKAELITVFDMKEKTLSKY